MSERNPTTPTPIDRLLRAWQQIDTIFSIAAFDFPSKPCPSCIFLLLTEVKGLYLPGYDDRPLSERAPGTFKQAGYFPGYQSFDDAGRLYINRDADGKWSTSKQFIELTVYVGPATVAIPPGAKVHWAAVDPDDPTDDDPEIAPEAGKILDPRDYVAASDSEYQKNPSLWWTKTGSRGGDNWDLAPSLAKTGFEQADPRYPAANAGATSADTGIDAATRTSKVRFHFGDIAGANWIIKAEIRPAPGSVTTVLPASTGIMTVWYRIEVEYVQMKEDPWKDVLDVEHDGAADLPIQDLRRSYDIARIQFDVSEFRRVDRREAFGENFEEFKRTARKYASKEMGEFKHQDDPGWFFVASCLRAFEDKHGAQKTLFEGVAQISASRDGLTIDLRKEADVRKGDTLYIFEPGLGPTDLEHARAHLDGTFYMEIGLPDGRVSSVKLEPKIYQPVDAPDVDWKANLFDCGFSPGQLVRVAVIRAGSVGIAGYAPWLGATLVFTRDFDTNTIRATLAHELCHAFGGAHRCGNWDSVAEHVRPPDRASRTTRRACLMCYPSDFVLEPSRDPDARVPPRRPIPWTQRLGGDYFCAQHIRFLRTNHVEIRAELRWIQ